MSVENALKTATSDLKAGEYEAALLTLNEALRNRKNK